MANVKVGDLARTVAIPGDAFSEEVAGHFCIIVEGPVYHPLDGRMGWVIDPPIQVPGERPFDTAADDVLRRIDNPGDDEVDSRDVLVPKVNPVEEPEHA